MLKHHGNCEGRLVKVRSDSCPFDYNKRCKKKLLSIATSLRREGSGTRRAKRERKVKTTTAAEQVVRKSQKWRKS